MTSIARRLLDELMGLDRNKPLHLRGPKQHRFNASDVCKCYLIDFCPYELFMNTKSDVGSCPYKLHDEIMKGEFIREGDAFREAYERKFVQKLEDLVADLERKLRRGKERLEGGRPSDYASISPENDEVEEKKILISAQIKDMLRRVEELGEAGKIGEAREMSNRAERLKEELDKLKQLDNDSSAFRIERKLEQCQTCGAMLVVNDAPLRVQSHFEGRQHNGWARVRQTLAEWKLKAPQYFQRHEPHDRHERDYRQDRDHRHGRHDHRDRHGHSERYEKRQDDPYRRDDRHHHQDRRGDSSRNYRRH